MQRKPKVNNKKKYILWGIGVVAVGVGGYFLYKKLRAKKDENDINDFKDDIQDGNLPTSLPTPTKVSSGYKPAPANSTLPLKRGSKGTLVKDVQNGLIRMYGGGILPKYGADGFYGSEMQKALTSKGYSTTIDSLVYGKIINGKATSSAATNKPAATSGSKGTTEVSSPTIAKLLHTAIEKDDIFKALEALKKITGTAKYSKVNEEFKKTKYWTFSDGYVSRTIVTALHSQFSSAEYKKKINTQLFRIGLKNDGDQWSLSGAFDLTQKLITIRSAQVWDASGRKLNVPKATILGVF